MSVTESLPRDRMMGKRDRGALVALRGLAELFRAKKLIRFVDERVGRGLAHVVCYHGLVC